MLKQRAQIAGVHVILLAYSLLAVGPILLVVMNSFKSRNAIGRIRCAGAEDVANSVTNHFGNRV